MIEAITRAWLELSGEIAGHEGVLQALIEDLPAESYIRERLIEQAAKLNSARRRVRELVSAETFTK